MDAVSCTLRMCLAVVDNEHVATRGETRFASALTRAPGFSYLEGQAVQGTDEEGCVVSR
eukprot:COSAG06_NODE_2192_length_7379_cov_804.628159_9_plen_59_part_00